MIEINERFTVPAPAADVYAVLSNPEAVVECVQGASLGEVHEDGTIDGLMTVSFSAIKVVFKGRFKLDLEPDVLRGRLNATGRDGQGGTKFTATASFAVEETDDSSVSEVTAFGAVEVSGRMASVISGAANAVVRRMTAEFVGALSRRCASGSTTLGPTTTGGKDSASTVFTAAATRQAPAAVLLLHGFGGSPSTLRSWGEQLAAAGATVSIPRLPGHGTRWKDLNRTGFSDWFEAANDAFTELRYKHDEVYVMGLSLGGLIALRLAQFRPAEVKGLVLVNPLVSAIAGTPRWSILRRSARVVVDNDVKMSDVRDVAYDRIPLKAAQSLRRAGEVVLAELGQVRQPVLLVSSAEDHVVSRSDTERISAGLTEADVQRVTYTASYHLVPLDHDAPALFAESLAFMRSVDMANPHA